MFTMIANVNKSLGAMADSLLKPCARRGLPYGLPYGLSYGPPPKLIFFRLKKIINIRKKLKINFLLIYQLLIF